MSLSYRRALKLLGSYWIAVPQWTFFGGGQRGRGKARRGQRAWMEFLEERTLFSSSVVVSDITKTETLHAASEAFTFADFNAAFSDTTNGATLQTIEVVSLPANGCLTVDGAPVIAGQNIAATDIGNLTYTQTGNFTGNDLFMWNGSDGTNFADNAANVTITIPADTAPVVSDISASIVKNTPTAFTPGNFAAGFSDADAGDTLQDIEILSLPTNGNLAFSGTPVTVDQSIDATDILLLTYTPAANFTGTDQFMWNGSDGTEFAATGANANITVTDTPPTVSDVSVTEPVHGTSLSFTLADFTASFTDPDAGDTLQSIEITSLPGNGTLTLDGNAVTVDQVVDASDIGNLTYTQTGNFTGNDTFGWNGSDGTLFATTGGNVNVTVTPDTPPEVQDLPISVTENVPFDFTLAKFTGSFSDVDGDTLASITIVDLPHDGNLTVDGNAVTAGEVIQSSDIDNLVFTPNIGFQGVDGFDWSASDGFESSTSTAEVILAIANTPPTVSGLNIPVFENISTPLTTAEFNAGFTDPDAGDSMQQIEIVTLPSHGNLSLSGNAVTAGEMIDTADIPDLVYTPSAGTPANDSFAWNASDGKQFGNTSATVILTATLPTLSPFTHAVTPSQTSNFTLSEFTGAFTDAVNGAALQSIEIIARPAHGTLFLNGVAVTANQIISASDIPNLTFTPTTGFIGSDSFTWKASDQGGFSAAAGTVTLGIDDAPISGNITKNVTVRATSVAFTLADFTAAFSDPDPGNTLQSIKITTLPTNGTLKLNGVAVTPGQVILANKIPLLVYTQTAGFVGTDNFTYEASDGVLFSVSAGPVTVNVPDTPPTVTAVTITTPENIAFTFDSGNFTGSFTDPDTGSALASVEIVTLPAHGNLSLNGNAVTAGESIALADLDSILYTPTLGFSGNDTFSWNASDGTDLADTAASVKISVTPPSFTTAENLHDTTATLTLDQFQGAFSGNPGDTLEDIQISKLPANGTLQATTNSGSGNVTAAVTAGETFDTTTLVSFTYTQLAGFSGTDSFTWNGSNGTTFTTNNAKGIITIPTDTAPTVGGFTVTIAENATSTFAHTFNLSDFAQQFTDPDSVPTGNTTTPDSISAIKITTLPKHGTLMLANSAVVLNQVIAEGDVGSLTYTPTTGFSGNDTFGYSASDSTLFALSPATVTMDVVPPVIANVSLTTVPGTPLAISSGSFVAQFTSPDTDTVTTGNTTTTDSLAGIKITSLPAHGKLTLSGVAVTANQIIALANISNLTYTPSANYHGTDKFNWSGTDVFSGATAFSANATVNLTVDNAPTVTDFALPVTQDITKTFTSANFTTNFADVDHDKLQSIEIISLPANGTLTLSGLPVTANQVISSGNLSKLQYVPTSGTAGADTFTYTASDGFENSAAPATVTLNVNTPPVVSAVDVTATPGGPLTFDPTNFNGSSFTDADAGDSLQMIKIASLPAHGKLTLNGVAVKTNQVINVSDISSLIYTPTVAFVGTDTFTWFGSDGKDYSNASAKVVIAVPSVLDVIGNSNPIVNKSITPSTTTFTDFGNWTTTQDPSMQDDVRTFTLQNFGNSTINIGSITLSNSTDFTVTQPISTILTANDSTTFTIEFNPTTVGKRTSNVTISDTGGNTLFTYSVQGNAVHTVSLATPTDATDTTTTGVVQVGTIQNGSGVGASNGEIISMSYTGYLANGSVFDATTLHGNVPLTFRLDDQFQNVGNITTQQPYINSDQTGNYSFVDFSVIPGWEYGLQGIKVGEKRVFIINSDAGYGSQGNGPSVPPNSTLVFEVQCTAINTTAHLGVESLDSSGNATAFLTAGQTAINSTDDTLFTLSSGVSSVSASYNLLTSGNDDITGASIGTWAFKGRGIAVTGDTKDFTVSLASATQLVVFFHPFSTGVHNATIHIETSDPTHPDFTFNVEGIAAPYVDMITEFNAPHFPTKPVTSGSTQTITVPIVIKNVGTVAVPANSKTNIQIYAKNLSTSTTTLVKLVNNIDISGLGADVYREMDQSVTLPSDLPTGSYQFLGTVNSNETQEESSPDASLAVINEINTSDNSAQLGTGTLVVIQGVHAVSGNLVSSTLISSAGGVSGNVTFNLNNTGTIALPSGEQGLVTVIARPVGTNDSSADVVLLSEAADNLISLSLLGSGSKTFTVPVSFALPLAGGSYDVIVQVTPVQSISDVGVVSLDANSSGNAVILTSGNA